MSLNSINRQWLFLTVALLILGGVIGWALYAEYTITTDQERELLINQAKVVDDNLEHELTATNFALDSIRNDLRTLKAGKNSVSQINHRLQIMRGAMFATRAITIFDADGTLVARSPDQFVGQNFSSREYFQIARQGGNPETLYVAQPFMAATGEYVLNVSKVLLDDRGGFAGVILVSLGPEYFSTLLKSVLYAPDMRSTLIHGDGKMIYRVPDPQGITGMDLAAKPDSAFNRHMKSGQQSSVFDGKASSSTGENRLTVLRTIRPITVPLNKPLVVGVSREISVLFAPWYEDIATYSGLFLLLTLTTTLGLLFHQKRQKADARLLAEQELKRRQMEEALKESEENLATTLYSIGDAVIATDTAGLVTRMNPMAERLTGWTLADACDRPLAEVFRILNAVTREAVNNPVHLVMAHGQVVGLANHTVLQARDGQEYQIADSAAPIRNPAGEIRGVVLVFSDVTEKYKLEKNLHLTRFSVDAASDAIFWMTPDAHIVDVNAAACHSLGYTRDELLQLCVPDVDTHYNVELWTQQFAELKQRGSMAFESEQRTKGGRLIPVEIVANYVKYGSEERNCAFVRDITARKTAEKEINSLAFYDPLTHLPNRRLLLDRLKQTLASSTRKEIFGALLFIDLDNFKTLNDTLGHDIGDLLLQQVAQRLAACVREGDTVARLGGDEYLVILEDLSANIQESAALAKIVGEKILVTLNKTYNLSKYEHHCTASIGVTLFADHQGTIDDLMKQADLAMYQAKAAGRNTLRFFDPEMQAVVTARAALEADLRGAIRQNQFLLYYQAQVDSKGHLTGVEVLLRWQHPQRGLVSPLEFIPLAEDTGLILPIGHWVMETACAKLADWAARPEMAHLTVAVNVSARQFHHPHFVDQVLAVLDVTGANPRLLKLELTESLLVDDIEGVIVKMSALKQKGVTFSLDDFGTGFSSLSYLKRLPLDQLKIDQSFVRDILTDPNDAAIAKMIIVLAESMGLAVIAEGVETAAQRDSLASQGCHAYQGYLFSRPLPLAEFEAYVRHIDMD